MKSGFNGKSYGSVGVKGDANVNWDFNENVYFDSGVSLYVHLHVDVYTNEYIESTWRLIGNRCRCGCRCRLRG